MTRSRQTADWGSRAGLAKIVPSSVAVGSGTGSADSLGTVTFSGVSSISLNDVFSATYTNYRIILTADSSVASVDVNMRMRVSATDNSSANYVWNRQQVNNGTAETATSGGSPATSFNLTPMSGGLSGFGVTDIVRPFATDNTGFSTNYFFYDGASAHASGRVGGITTVTTSYTGFTLIMGSGTMTGTISVYGYTI